MEIFKFIIFLFASHFGVMQIFRLSTYHAYFCKVLPLLIGYGALVAFCLFSLKMHSFFLWQIVFSSIWLFIVARHQDKSTQAMLDYAGDDADSVRLVAESSAKTSRYFTYSSFVYVIVFAMTYMWLYNT